MSNINDKKGKRFIPPFVSFPQNIRNQFNNDFKLMKDTKGDYKLYMSPLMKTSLDSLNRGRTSRETQSRLSTLTLKVQEKIPQNVRGILKNYSPKLNPSIGMYPINNKISSVDNGNIEFFNPNSIHNKELAYDNIISENNIVDRLKNMLLESLKEDAYKKKTNFDYKSKLSGIITNAFQEKDVNKAKDMVIKFLEPTNIKEKDNMIKTIKSISNKQKLDTYLANSLLKFEKLGIRENVDILTSQPEITYNIDDQIGNFWIVKNAMKESTEDELIQEMDIFSLAEKISNKEIYKADIAGIYSKENKARRAVSNNIRTRDKDLKETIKTGNELVNKLTNIISNIKSEIQTLTKKGHDNPMLRDACTSDIGILNDELSRKESVLDRLIKSLEAENSNKDE